MKVSLIGMGFGGEEALTGQAKQALSQAQLVIGAPRLIETLSETVRSRTEIFQSIQTKEIARRLSAFQGTRACVLFSGDTGFYSGAVHLEKVLSEMREYECEYFPGISSVQMLAAKLHRPWQEWKLVSAHGVSCCAAAEIDEVRPTFFLTGGMLTAQEICRQLTQAGMGTLEVTAGQELFTSRERIVTASAEELAKQTFPSLTVLLVQPFKKPFCHAGMPDDSFIRGKTPMTKQEVRAVVMAKLALQPEETVWDVGAGTGSVSVEMARAACRGQVYAIERNDEACGLIEQNRQKFAAWNLHVQKGKAPDALLPLPAPDAVFIGGSGGNMKEIIRQVYEKNKNARICVTAIAPESLSAAVEALREHGKQAEITQISAARSRPVGGLHMMEALNPIWIVTEGCHA